MLIVGAGPTGLVLAIELQRRGVPYRIIDRAQTNHNESRATTLHPLTLEVFHDLGVLEPVLEAGIRYTDLGVYSENRLLMRQSLSHADAPYPFMVGLAQHDTEAILERRLEALGGEVERGVRFADLRQSEERVKTVLLHPDGRWDEPEFEWVVGCDGVYSNVRRSLEIPFAGSAYPEDFFIFDLSLDCERPYLELMAQTSSQGMLVFTPIPGEGRFVRIGGDLPPGFEGELDEQAARRLVEERLGCEFELSNLRWAARFNIQTRHASAYRKGRGLLCGDSAHVHSPVSGLGMNTGVQDAYNLGWKLALVVQGHADPALLDSYHAERHPIGAAHVSLTDFQTDVFLHHDSFKQRLTLALGSALSGLTPTRRRMIEAMVDLSRGYPDSPITAEHRASMLRATLTKKPSSENPSVGDFLDFSGAPAAGYRAPDVALGDDNLLERLRGVEHVLLMFDGMAPTPEGYSGFERCADTLARCWPGLVRVIIVVPYAERPAALDWDGELILDAQRSLHARYGAGAECLYLIRPDGYVGFRSQPFDSEALYAHIEVMLGRGPA